jgi:hypothetical protein
MTGAARTPPSGARIEHSHIAIIFAGPEIADREGQFKVSFSVSPPTPDESPLSLFRQERREDLNKFRRLFEKRVMTARVG